jgi:predicted dithiol-disulfide oxidoreductase (DUF899 family)
VRSNSANAAAGGVFHTYSCYARGLDMMNATYHYLDLVPKGIRIISTGSIDGRPSRE